MLKIVPWLKIASLLGVTFLLSGCTSGSFPTFDTVITNIGNNITPMLRMVTGGAYLFGFGFVFRGIFMLKAYGDQRTMMSSQANLKGALICLFVGAALIYYPTLEQILLMTAFSANSTSPLQYQTNITMNQTAYFSLLKCVQLIGTISFIRGWIMLTHLANPSQQNSFGKAMTHIVGGLMAVNIQGTIDILKGTIGMS